MLRLVLANELWLTAYRADQDVCALLKSIVRHGQALVTSTQQVTEVKSLLRMETPHLMLIADGFYASLAPRLITVGLSRLSDGTIIETARAGRASIVYGEGRGLRQSYWRNGIWFISLHQATKEIADYSLKGECIT